MTEPATPVLYRQTGTIDMMLAARDANQTYVFRQRGFRFLQQRRHRPFCTVTVSSSALRQPERELVQHRDTDAAAGRGRRPFT